MEQIKSTTFDVQLTGGKAKVVRRIEFASGEVVSFEIALPDAHNLTIIDLHQKSARRVIDLLEEWLKPQAPQA